MYLLIWILGFPTILYHFLFTLAILTIILCCKLSKYNSSKYNLLNQNTNRIRTLRRAFANQFDRSNNLFGKMYGQTMDKLQRGKPKLSHLTLVLLAVSTCCSNFGHTLEEDAILLKPFADVAKSIIAAITTGVPEPIQLVSTPVLMRSFVVFSWRTKFPYRMPTDFIEKARAFYERINTRVSQTDVSELGRKRLVALKVDLDNIVDAIQEEVRRSPDGLYTNYLATRVNGQPLEEACFQVALQLKAYGIDITNYRNIAGAVLGVPVIPQVASTVVDVGKGVQKAAAPVVSLPGVAFRTVSEMSGQALNSVQQLVPTAGLASLNPVSGYMQQQPVAAMQVLA